MAGPEHWAIVDIAQPCIAEGHVAGLMQAILVLAGCRPLDFSRPYFPGYALLWTNGLVDMYLASPEIRFGRVKIQREMKWMVEE